MGFIELLSTRACLGAVIALVAVLVSATGFSQDPIQTASALTREQYRELIDATEEGGAYSAGLVEPLTALGILHRTQGDYQRATESLERARQVLRVNHGLSTLAEIHVLEELVRTGEAGGNIAEALTYEQALLTLAQVHVGNLQTYPVFREMADKRMSLLNRYRSGERPPQIFLGCYYAKTLALSKAAVALNEPYSDSECLAGDRRTVERALLIEAITYQTLALEALLQNDRYLSAEMQDLMVEIFRSSNHLHHGFNRHTDYFIGPVWRRALTYDAQDSASRARRTEFRLLFADLNLIRLRRAYDFSDYDELHEQYRQAYFDLATEGIGQETLDRMFTPPLPVVLPVYVPNPFSLVEGEGQGEYIDLAFNINQRGQARQVQIIATSNGVTRTERRKVLRQIREIRFRPRLENGEIVDAAPVVVRHHVNAGPRKETE